MKSKTNDRTLLGVAALVVGIMIVLGWSFAPSVTSVSAANQEGQDGATAEMLAYALNFKSAQSLGVFGGNSVTDQGSEIRGVVGSTGDVLGVQSNALSVGDSAENRRDLLDAFSAVDQLPCTQVDDSNLGGRSFGPGVYCLGSATLAGRMTVDAGGDANARFVFRVDGTFTAEDASSIVREGGAQATNVYLFSRNAASIGANATIGGNVISREDVTVGHGSTVSGKVIGVNGDVTTDSNIVAAGTAYVEICKQLAQFDRIPVGTIFNFTVTGVAATIQVPAGAFQSPNCSPPILVASGNVSVTEAVRANTAVVGIQANPNSRLLGSSSLAAQRADLIVPDGDVTNQTVVTFTNQTTRTGTIEICKFAAPARTLRTTPDLPADPDVTGFFNFTVQGATGTFAVPVGFCSGPITVTLLQTNAGPSPSPTQAFTTNVTELAKPTYVLEDVTTFPAGALTGPFTPDAGFDANGVPFPACPAANCNQNGGFANVALNIAGGAANQTTVRFFNRSLPGRIKVCKITADPVNIPVGTTFSFGIAGLAGPLPGTTVNFDAFDVLAGPAAQGGFCAFAPRTWVVGSNVVIFEIGISPNNTTTLPLGLAATQAGLATSRIQASTPFVTPPFTVPAVMGPFTLNPSLGTVGSGNLPYGVITARNTTAEIEFTNFVYRPAILKLCKTSSTIAAGTPFTFTIAPADPLTTWPYPTTTITVPVGSCTFVNGPFPANAQFPGVGLFNFGTSIIVTENAVPGVAVLGISSPTLTPVPNPNPPNFVGTLTVDLNNRRGTLTLNQILGLPVAAPTTYFFNELTFNNGPASAPPQARPARFDFDGDHASDIALFRPSDGNWYYNASGTGQVRAVHFGQAGDVPVAADYDGDGTTDPAVFRNGQWYVLGSTAGFSSISFGLSTDIPQVGDYDGDGKADFAVYRQSNGSWYVMGSSTGFKAVQFGISTDVPVAADFDGDGKTDPAVYRNGTWYINGSTAGFSGVQFGTAGDKPVQADYDGDGRSDVAVYRGGTWYIMGSSNGFRAAQFGTSTDTPVPADYDGDGKTDIAVYRSSETNWYILNSSQAGNAVGGFSAKQFGSAGDLLMGY